MVFTSMADLNIDQPKALTGTKKVWACRNVSTYTKKETMIVLEAGANLSMLSRRSPEAKARKMSTSSDGRGKGAAMAGEMTMTSRGTCWRWWSTCMALVIVLQRRDRRLDYTRRLRRD